MSISVPSPFRFRSVWSRDTMENEHISTATLPLIVFIFALFCFIRSWKTKNQLPPLPPGPRGLPLVGYLPFLTGDLHRSFADLAKIHGPVVKLRLGTRLCVILSSPSTINEALREQETVFANRDPTVCALLATYGGSDIVFSDNGHEWKKLRKVFARKMLSKANLDDSYSLRRQEVRKVIRDVYEKIGSPIDIGEVGFFAVFKSIMAMMWGGSGRVIGEEEADLRVKFKETVAQIMVSIGRPNVSDLFPALSRFDLQGIGRRMKKLMRVCDEVLDFAIEQQRKMGRNSTEKKGFLQWLLELEGDEDNSESISINQIKALLMDVVIGGTDTTSTVLEWTMAELMQHPEAMKKVNSELTEVVGLNQTVEEFHLPKLCFLNAVIKETLRLHPALPLLIPRTPTQTTTIGGFSIPQGSVTYFNIWAIKRDPKIWESPLEFMPERFLKEPEKFDFSGNSIEFCPFGSGRRLCVGLPLAERMLVYALASFLHCFEWKLPDGSQLDLQEKFGIVLKKLNPLVAIPMPRLSSLDLYQV